MNTETATVIHDAHKIIHKYSVHGRSGDNSKRDSYDMSSLHHSDGASAAIHGLKGIGFEQHAPNTFKHKDGTTVTHEYDAGTSRLHVNQPHRVTSGNRFAWGKGDIEIHSGGKEHSSVEETAGTSDLKSVLDTAHRTVAQHATGRHTGDLHDAKYKMEHHSATPEIRGELRSHGFRDTSTSKLSRMTYEHDDGSKTHVGFGKPRGEDGRHAVRIFHAPATSAYKGDSLTKALKNHPIVQKHLGAKSAADVKVTRESDGSTYLHNRTDPHGPMVSHETTKEGKHEIYMADSHGVGYGNDAFHSHENLDEALSGAHKKVRAQGRSETASEETAGIRDLKAEMVKHGTRQLNAEFKAGYHKGMSNKHAAAVNKYLSAIVDTGNKGEAKRLYATDFKGTPVEKSHRLQDAHHVRSRYAEERSLKHSENLKAAAGQLKKASPTAYRHAHKILSALAFSHAQKAEQHAHAHEGDARTAFKATQRNMLVAHRKHLKNAGR